MQINKRLIPINFTKGGNKKLGVVIHTMVGTLAGTDAWFRNPTAQVSSHYGIDLDGETVYQWVEENDRAYCQGSVKNPTAKMVLERPGVNPNSYMISIENADNGDPAGRDRSQQYPTIIALVKEICARNGIPIDREHIYGHHEIRADKTCPGNLSVDYIVAQAQEGSSMTDQETIAKLTADLTDANKTKENLQSQVNGWVRDSQNGTWVSKADAQAKYDAGFAAGKATIMQAPVPDPSKWEVNGMEVAIQNSNIITTTNYKLK